MSLSRADLAARRRQLREDIARRKAAARSAFEARYPELVAAEKRRRTRRRQLLVLLAVLLLLMLVPDCQCTEPPEPMPEPVVETHSPGTAEAVPGEVASPAPTGRISSKRRPTYETAPPQPLTWLDEFRIQVAARSPRLSDCFVGVARPGALKWSTAVEPALGRVSDHTIEPTLLTEPLTRQQKRCIIDVLSEPHYQLKADERSTPSRVSLLIEF